MKIRGLFSWIYSVLRSIGEHKFPLYDRKFERSLGTGLIVLVFPLLFSSVNLDAVLLKDLPGGDNVPDALSDTNLIVDMRGRYEYADQDGRENSNAWSLRTRLGLDFYLAEEAGFLIELENVVSIGQGDEYTAFPGPGRTVIADPQVTELNRAQLSFGGENFQATLGRQRMILNNARFVGNVGWRQNEQTYDAVLLKADPLEGFDLLYSYIFRVNRIFGDRAPSDALKKFDSDSHLLEAGYSGWENSKVRAYAYFLDLDNAKTNSCNTYGLSFDGILPSDSGFQTIVHAEYARQESANGSPLKYDADYLHLSADAKFSGFTAGGGYELLGSDNGAGFRTPLATLHKFNGWADKFLGTPGAGLRDLYAAVSFKDGLGGAWKIMLHDFQSDAGDTDLGEELDAQVGYTINKNWKVLTKVAIFSGGSTYTDTTRFWLQAELKY